MSQVKLTADTGGGTTSIKGPAQTTGNADVVFKLPIADGSSGEVLKTDGSGQLSFTSNAGTTINNNADNRIITGSGTANTLNGESSLTWNGSAMGVGLSSPSDTLHVFHATDNLVARFESGDTGGGITLKDNTHVTSLLTTNGAFEINVDQGGDISGETIAFKMSGSEKMRIDSSGRLLLGDTDSDNAVSDSDNLVIGAASGDNGMTIVSQSGNYNGSIRFSDGSNTGADSYRGTIQYYHGENYMRFYTDATERMRITSAGKFYVGTTSGAFGNDASQHAAIVNSAANVYTLSLRNNLDSSNGRGLLVAAGNGSGGRLIFFERFDGGTLGSITVASSSSVSYNTSSDYRLKENVTTITDGITRLKTLKPSRFNWKDDPDTTFDGFIAHEVSSVVPEAITGTKDEVDENNEPVYQGIDQSKLVPLLTAALQEEVAKREALEARVAALEAA